MCEIFGNYGWSEDVRLEKYLADHFLVRGINQFVPHAFSPKKFPDPDCPPHFYAHGHNPLVVNQQSYHAFIISETGSPLPEMLTRMPVVQLSELADTFSGLGLSVPMVRPANNRIRILQIAGDTPVYFIVNEGTEDFTGTITFHEEGPCYLYDPWFNVCRFADANTVLATVQVKLTIEPLKSVAVVFCPCDVLFTTPIICTGEAIELTQWKRITCQGIAYPDFGEVSFVSLPDNIAEEQPEFSGFARYETSIYLSENHTFILEITDAAEGVEVFVNGKSLGIQIAPPFRYDLSDSLTEGESQIAIEVAATLERQCYPLLDAIGKMVTKPPSSGTGLTGLVRLYQK